MAVKYIGRDRAYSHGGRRLFHGDVVDDDTLASRFDFELVNGYDPSDPEEEDQAEEN